MESEARTSMMHSTKTVPPNQKVPLKINTTQPKIEVGPRDPSRVIDHNTSDSCACANERAQSRRYEAVWEIHPRQNSMV